LGDCLDRLGQRFMDGEFGSGHGRSHCLFDRIPPPKAVCPDLLIGVKSMAYVMRYNHFPD